MSKTVEREIELDSWTTPLVWREVDGGYFQLTAPGHAPNARTQTRDFGPFESADEAEREGRTYYASPAFASLIPVGAWEPSRTVTVRFPKRNGVNNE